MAAATRSKVPAEQAQKAKGIPAKTAKTARKPRKPAGAGSGNPAAGKPAAKPLALDPEAVRPGPPRSAKPKQKLVRDSFTMPSPDFALIATLKDRMVAFRRPAKKSELLRAGLHALTALPDAKLAAALDRLAELKPGRPRKDV